MSDPVIFRTFKRGGDVIALFPLQPGNGSPDLCMSYMHVGQHGAASPGLCRDGSTRPATPKEICRLACELRGIGYKLRGLSRMPSNARAARAAVLAKYGVRP